MSNRLDKEREGRLQSKRIIKAINSLGEFGIVPTLITTTTIEFKFKDAIIRFYPYSGWHTGKTIKDGRGLQNLIKQLK